MKNKVLFTIIMLILLMGIVFAKTTLNVDINSDGVTDIKDVKAIAEKIINKNSISSTTDGLHWNPDTVHKYLKLVLEEALRLK